MHFSGYKIVESALIKRLSLGGVMSILLFVFSAPAAYPYNAQDTINFSVTGNIVDGSCNITIPDHIDLGSARKGDFSVAGASTANVSVPLLFDECAATLNQVVLTFSGTPDDVDDQVYANQATDGAATDVGMQLLVNNGTNTILSNGSSYAVDIDPDLHKASVEAIARMYSPQGQPTAGIFTTVVTVTVGYN